MPEQLPEIAFRRCRYPDARKALGQQHIQNEPGVACIGLLLAHLRGANLGRVSDPQLVAEFGKQAFKPVHRTGRFDAHAHRSLQAAVKRLGFAVVVIEPAFEE